MTVMVVMMSMVDRVVMWLVLKRIAFYCYLYNLLPLIFMCYYCGIQSRS